MKQVRFDPTTSVRRLKQLLQPVVDDEDSGSSAGSTFWLTDEDYSRIRRGIKKDVRKARAIISGGENVGTTPTAMDGETESTLRGIEHLQSREVLQRQINDKDRAIEAVFREQERQADAGTAIDDGAIAKAYGAHSRQARQAAIVRAACDEAFVLANRTPTTSTSNTTSQHQQPLDVLMESLEIDLGTSQAQTNGRPTDSTGTSTREGAARTTSDMMGTWLNHHDSLRLDETKGLSSRRPSTGSTDMDARAA